jgi:NAD(P)H-nitrite reductase large subunit
VDTLIEWADEFTIICRCEEVSKMEIIDAIKMGAKTPDDIKRITRCGMGHCQWKTCKSSVMLILKEQGFDSMVSPKIRSPLSPITIEKIANIKKYNFNSSYTLKGEVNEKL